MYIKLSGNSLFGPNTHFPNSIRITNSLETVSHWCILFYWLELLFKNLCMNINHLTFYIAFELAGGNFSL
jgi:hypothetical protein